MIRIYLIGALALALMLGVWRWHANAVDEAVQEAKDACEAAALAAQNEILARYAEQTGIVSAMVQNDQAKLAERLDEIVKANAERLSAYRSTTRAKPLPTGCVLDAGRVRDINTGRQRVPSAGS